MRNPLHDILVCVAKHKRGRGTERTPVLALEERSGNVHSRVVADVSAKTLQAAIKERVDFNAAIFTDEWNSYRGVGKYFSGGHADVRHNEGEYSVNASVPQKKKD